MVHQVVSVILLVLGFGFVVFFHELGHFLAAKWVGIKVEQFAVGFGQALFSWRKGMGWSIGSSRKKYEELIRARIEETERAGKQASENASEIAEPTYQQTAKAAEELGLGDTEYRLNWIPLGGYVKMLGQDDLKPGAANADDPRAYSKKSIGARMIVVSAGVIMNVILAAIGFMIVFLIGFKAPPTTIGTLMPNSPAQRAGLRVGDTILYIDNKWQYDFSKVGLTVALLHEGQDIPFVVSRPGPDGKPINLTVMVRPQRMDADPKGFLSIGIQPGWTLKGLPAEDYKLNVTRNPESGILATGETITAVRGEPADPEKDFYKLSQALQASNGQPVPVTITGADGKTRDAKVPPHFDKLFGTTPMNFGGLQPRIAVASVIKGSAAIDKLMPGDAIASATVSDLKQNPTEKQFLELVHKAIDEKKNISLDVVRDGKTISVKDLSLTAKWENGRGLGIAMMVDEQHPVTGDILPGSAAEKAGIPAGSTITAIDGQPVASWFDVRHLLDAEGLDKSHPTLHSLAVAGREKPFSLDLSSDELQFVHNVRVGDYLLTQPQELIRKTTSPLRAAQWGVGETRDFILQFYVTLERMREGSVSASNMMGPLGIVTVGSKFAFAGTDKLIWFLAMISANLAVVNFLPIPIVDGGLFTFLIVEKIQGRPLSGKAQVAWQIVGLALIGSVFLLVTYGDIHRMFLQ